MSPALCQPYLIDRLKKVDCWRVQYACLLHRFFKTHQSAFDNYREYDAGDHRHPAMETHGGASGLLPSPDSPTDWDAEQPLAGEKLPTQSSSQANAALTLVFRA